MLNRFERRELMDWVAGQLLAALLTVIIVCVAYFLKGVL